MIFYNGKNYPIVCLCGSTRFKQEILLASYLMTKKGFIVTMPMIFGHSGDNVSEEEKKELDNLHKAKILNADIVYIVNKDGYIGESTKSEIEFAKLTKKVIKYMEEDKAKESTT